MAETERHSDQPSRRFCVAPMMDWTDRHCRFLHRQFSRHALLYTEMVTAEAILHGNLERLLDFDPPEQPVALQLGGSDPEKLARAARICADWGYREINLNVGCPSDRVQSGRFGACLMAEPETVSASVSAMIDACDLPVTVKCRIGIDDVEGDDFLRAFVEPVATAGCRTFIVHARKAVLSGLSPKENREIPPLRYDVVYRLKQARPDLEIVINGGIADLDEADGHLAHVDGVMLGRAAYHSPALLRDVDHRLFDDPRDVPDERDAVLAMFPYIESQLARGQRLNAITRHMLGLFQGRPGARAWRRHLSEGSVRPGAGVETVRTALAFVTSGSFSQPAA